MLLDGKRLVITGVLTDDSIAWHAARIAMEAGRRSDADRVRPRHQPHQASARRLPVEPDVVELDINDPDHMEALAADIDRVGARATGRSTPSHMPRGCSRRQLPEHTGRVGGDRVHHLGLSRTRRLPSGCAH